MFEPIIITDSVHDATSVYVDTYDDDPRVMIKVEDQTLLEYLREDVEDSQAVARGSYTLGQARQLRDALDKAITEVEARTCGDWS